MLRNSEVAFITFTYHYVASFTFHYRKLMSTLCKYLLSCHLNSEILQKEHHGKPGNALLDGAQKCSSCTPELLSYNTGSTGAQKKNKKWEPLPHPYVNTYYHLIKTLQELVKYVHELSPERSSSSCSGPASFVLRASEGRLGCCFFKHRTPLKGS